jgi:hypothetical protein
MLLDTLRYSLHIMNIILTDTSAILRIMFDLKGTACSVMTYYRPPRNTCKTHEAQKQIYDCRVFAVYTYNGNCAAG